MSTPMTAERINLSGPQENVLLQIALGFKERAEALKLKGKRRDDAALDFFCGAAKTLEILGHVKEYHIVGANIMIIAVRGYVAISEIIQANEKPG